MQIVDIGPAPRDGDPSAGVETKAGAKVAGLEKGQGQGQGYGQGRAAVEETANSSTQAEHN